MSRKRKNWCQNEVYEKTKEDDSRDKEKHNSIAQYSAFGTLAIR